MYPLYHRNLFGGLFQLLHDLSLFRHLKGTKTSIHLELPTDELRSNSAIGCVPIRDPVLLCV